MSSISDPNNAVQQLAYRLVDNDDADDPGLLADAGKELLEVAAIMAKKVRQTNKACTGEVTLTFKIKAHRTKNKEVALEFEPTIKSKKPHLSRARGVQLYAGHEGELETRPVQEEMPLFTKDTAKVVEGDKGSENAGKAGRKMKAV